MDQMENAGDNQSPSEEKKSDNPEHINIKVIPPASPFSQIISNRVGR
jgi:hypothetical protein